MKTKVNHTIKNTSTPDINTFPPIHKIFIFYWMDILTLVLEDVKEKKKDLSIKELNAWVFQGVIMN